LDSLINGVQPDFFRIGYYHMMNPGEDLTSYDTEELNEIALNYLNENFMNRFIALETAGVKYSYEKALEYKREVVAAMPSYRDYYENATLEKAEAKAKCAEISDLVEKSIDKLEFIKDSAAYTFRSGLSSAINQYFFYEKNNPKEEARFERQSKKREALISRGKKVDWKVVPKNVVDLADIRANMLLVIDRLIERYNAYIDNSSSVDFNERSIALIDYLKERANDVVYKVTKSMAREKAIKLMEEVGIPEPRIRYYQYPFEFSGGMRQRIVIAIALAANPDILICDEPTTALDVTIQAQILELINKLKKERNLSVIFITHDLGVVANMADKIAVMYAGKIVEYGTADDIFYEPRHPYTWALLSSMPDLDTSEKLDAIPGTPPNMIYPPVGDAFAERNKYALKIDFEEQPPMFRISDTHWAATWLLHPDAPKVDIPKTITDRIERMIARDKAEQEGGQLNG
ncbi:MAG: ATP-binding cassette domain-containing protein, partial [Clostridia bacterium]|nr:ATP-binding cassette domain-containing protein [Clostridia bacterium]